MSGVQLYQVRLFCIALHLIALLQYGYAIYYDYYLLNLTQHLDKLGLLSQNDFGGRAKYLTYWCLLVQMVYFSISLLNDLFGTNEVAPKSLPFIRKVKDYLLAAFAWPIACTVSITFWTIYAYDRELVFPKIIDTFFPDWLNHILHSNILISIVVEMFCSFRQYPSKMAGLTGLTIFMLSYLVWVNVIYYVSGVWVYPILEVLTLPLRLIFYAAYIGFAVFMYRIGEFMNTQIWTRELKAVLKAKKAH